MKGMNMSDPRGNQTYIKMPELIGICTACKEYTNAYDPCCNSPIYYEGGYEHMDELRDQWESETGLSWELTFEG